MNEHHEQQDGTRAFPDQQTPVDKVQLCQAVVARAKVHVDNASREFNAALRELDIAIRNLIDVASGGHK
jgi:hypothetical protein